MQDETKGSLADVVQRIINELAAGWGKSPYEINNGDCEEFMAEVVERMGGHTDDLHDLDSCGFAEFGELPTHVWICLNKRHYDAECPEGVDDWRDLPIFSKAKNNPHYAPVFQRLQDELDENGWVINPRMVW